MDAAAWSRMTAFHVVASVSGLAGRPRPTLRSGQDTGPETAARNHEELARFSTYERNGCPHQCRTIILPFDASLPNWAIAHSERETGKMSCCYCPCLRKLVQSLPERCPRGSWCRSRKAVVAQVARGFESHPLRSLEALAPASRLRRPVGD